MKVVKKITEWRGIKASLGQQTLGFVPTMGFLHEGHLSLVQEAKKRADVVVMSIFVNPLQFGENEDFSTYPRDMARDQKLAEQAGVDYLFAPDVQEMYPEQTRTNIHVHEITEKLCGASRPGHFTGVATVVAKLFNIIQPDFASFGQKDAQQVAVIEQLVQDLNFPVQVLSCPIIREEDGLAKSSRNVYLSQEERKQATILYASLQQALEQINKGERRADKLKKMIQDQITSAPLAQIDYVDILSYPSLAECNHLEGKIIIALAVKFGRTRLIDNIIVNVCGEEAALCSDI